MGEERGLVPTLPASVPEYQRWSAIYGGEEYFYGSEPGPLARRAVRYHRQYRRHGGTALDAGCGEGQDLAFFAERGYVATGVEFTEAGAAKAERLLRSRGLAAEVRRADLRTYELSRGHDLVLAANTLQFLGADGDACLRRLVAAVTAGGVLAISIFARPDRGASQTVADEGEEMGRRSQTASGALSHGFWLLSMEELMGYLPGWQMLEAARLWQWNTRTNEPQPFLTLIARNAPAAGPPMALP